MGDHGRQMIARAYGAVSLTAAAAVILQHLAFPVPEMMIFGLTFGLGVFLLTTPVR